MEKRIPFLFIFIFLLAAIFSGSFLISEIKKFENEISEIFLDQISTSFKKQASPITLFFVGDIMLDRGVEWQVQKDGKGDFKFPFLKIADELKTDDILIPSETRNQGSVERSEAWFLFGNLEGPISDKGRKVGSIYSFRMDPESIEGLKYAGFDVLSVANNHIFDYGREAMEDTFLRLREAQIDYVGGGFNEKEAYSPVIKEIRGIKIALLAYTNLGSENWKAQKDRPGIAWLEEERLREDIKTAKEKADLVIVSFHFGEEYQTKSNSLQKFWAHLSIDSGADLVIGHHPHVVQEIEEYRGKYIAYSLGNFIFDQGFSKETMEGLLLKVIIENTKIKEVIPIEIQINKYFQPEIP